MMKIEIKNRWNGSILFAHEAENNSLAITLAMALNSRANLYGADLSGANLSRADLSGADLSGANLYGADLSGANLYGADLSGANLYGANLSGANLYGANLYGADLSGANLYGANLYGAKGAALALARTQITPQEGAFVGWKKLNGGEIARLVIPHDALRLNAYGSRKCRASKVFVHEIWKGGVPFTGKSFDRHAGKTTYTVGAEVFPDKFDDDKRVECTSGIHFFLTREEAEAD